ncbi:MAG: tetratricopeptide repeat protein [Gemmatimonadaceae bacterium]
MISRTIRALVLSAATIAASACFATRNDVRTLQGDLAVLRAENARADSVHRAEFQKATVAVAAVADSVRAVNAYLARFSTDVSRFQGDLSITMHTFGQQLLTIQELLGQTQKRMQDVRADLERQQADLASAAQPSSASPSAPPAAAGGATQPGPAQLYQLGEQMMQRGNYETARATFIEMLAQFPNDPNAGEAQYEIAHSFDLGGQSASADSAYAIVVDKYPKTPHASSALYKRGKFAQLAGQTAKAMALFQQLVAKYPGSPEATSAADLLKKP